MCRKPVVLVVDDEDTIRDVVAAYLEKHDCKVCCAKTGREALDNFDFFPPDIVLLDLMLPDISGEAVCRKIREKSKVPIVMLTAKSAEESVIHGLALGADDYIKKPFSPGELVARVKAALRRSGVLEALPERIACGNLVVDTRNRRVEKAGSVLALTHNEYKLLLLFMTAPARIFSRDEIIEHIKGLDFDGFDRTIDTHIKNLRQKIGDNPKNPQYIETVYGMGYRFAGQLDDRA